MRKVKISVVVVVAVFSLLLSTAGAVTADDLANTLNSGWSSSGGSNYGSWYSVALYWLRTIGGNVSTATTSLGSIKTNTDNLSTILTRLTSLNSSMSTVNTNIGYIESNVSSIKSDVHSATLDIDYIYTLLTRAGTLGSDVNSIKSSANSIYTDVNSSKGYLTNLDYNVARLAGFFVNADHKALEDATTGAVQSATDMVTSNPGGTTQAQKNAAISGFSTSMAGALDTGVDSGAAWSFLTSGDAQYQSGLLPSGRSGNIFAFFSTETMYDLDPSLATRALQPEVVDYLSLNQASFNRLIGEGSDQR